MLFDEYLFADYSGAHSSNAQRRSIRLAAAWSSRPASIVHQRMTRAELTGELVRRLEQATEAGRRICFGQDHQYGVPWALVEELSLDGIRWRDLIEMLATGAYGEGAPALGHPNTFAAAFNTWLTGRGSKPYFYSATKAVLYGLPRMNPRAGELTCYRLTELRRPKSGAGSPKPFNRVGDNGTVGGQSLVGILAIRSLLQACARRHIRVAVWPFDGLSVTDDQYLGAHVMIEPYPSAVRVPGVIQSDESDALACANHVREADITGELAGLLDLSRLDAKDAAIASVEGWIVSHT